MKGDYTTRTVKNATVFVKDIKEVPGGIYVTFQDILSDEKFEHFQVMPDMIESYSNGKSKAETYLRRLARAADLDKDYLVLDMTVGNHLRDVKPIIGRVFQITVKVKRAVKGSRYDVRGRRDYNSAEDIWHFEGDGEFSLYNAMWIIKHGIGLSQKEREFRLFTLHSNRRFSERTFEEFKDLYENKVR